MANIIYSDRLNATWVKCHLVAFNPGGNYQGNQWIRGWVREEREEEGRRQRMEGGDTNYNMVNCILMKNPHKNRRHLSQHGRRVGGANREVCTAERIPIVHG